MSHLEWWMASPSLSARLAKVGGLQQMEIPVLVFSHGLHLCCLLCTGGASCMDLGFLNDNFRGALHLAPHSRQSVYTPARRWHRRHLYIAFSIIRLHVLPLNWLGLFGIWAHLVSHRFQDRLDQNIFHIPSHTDAFYSEVAA